MAVNNRPTPYRVYDLMTQEELGRFETYALAACAYEEKATTVIYRPSKRKVKK